VPIAVETGVNYLRPRPDELPDGEFVAQVVEAADCGIPPRGGADREGGIMLTTPWPARRSAPSRSRRPRSGRPGGHGSGA
jgi:hypothetical protein